MLTVPEVAQILKLSKPATYLMLNTGEIPGLMRLGPRRLRVSRQKFEQWLAAQ